MLELTDLFAGAGGSSTGAVAVADIKVRVASNHWALAIESHAANHPDTDHIQADLSQIDPRLFPRTDLLWASPSCTHHSGAQGKKRTDLEQPDLFGDTLPDDAAERSRATMWDVVRFSEHHAYQAVVVENVVEVALWPPFKAWLLAMESIGYDHRVVYINSMHAQLFGAGAPQSRDRIYIVFWRSGNRAPELDRVVSPPAVCPDHDAIDARQVFKRADRTPWGRYRAQYLYICGVTGCQRVVEPAYRPAADAIDWKLLGQRIGDRDKPLAAKTTARIRAGIEKYWAPLLVPVEGRNGKAAASVDAPARTMTSRNETGLLVPCGGSWRDKPSPTHEPMAARTTRDNDALAFVAELRGGGSKHRPVTDPLATVTASGNHHGLVTTYYGNGSTRPIDDVLFRMLEPHEIAAAMDFPVGYILKGNKRERVRQAGAAVCPPNARDLIGVVAESLGAP